MSRDELQRGASLADPPVPPFFVISGKSVGISPGFSMTDSKGRRYFVKYDPKQYPELATGADVIVSKFLYAIGYNTPSNEIVDVSVGDLRLGHNAKVTLPGGKSRPMTWRDVKHIIKNIGPRRDGTFRIVASLAIEGEPIGPFLWEGTRTDDPNDIVPHQNRRDLRGLDVFYAWMNNTDAKADNTLDAVVARGRIRFIRHYLIDFGSALGSDGDVPKDPRLGNEYMLGTPIDDLKKVITLGVPPEAWERVHFPNLSAVGNFQSSLFDPNEWKPDYPNPAFLSRLPDDEFWAAKQVMAFTDDDIRAIVETARYTDPQAAAYIVSTLADRRDKIGRAFFSKLLPLDHFRVEGGELAFDDLAVQYGFHLPRRHRVQWFRFDNANQTRDAILKGNSAQLPVEVLRAPDGSYFSASVDSPDEPLKPVSVYLRKQKDQYKVVGIDRSW
jgi:hypothetical protein